LIAHAHRNRAARLLRRATGDGRATTGALPTDAKATRLESRHRWRKLARSHVEAVSVSR
jgi:hypothetical protein